MIHFYPGVRVVDSHGEPPEFPGMGWAPRSGVITSIEHADERCLWVQWDGEKDPVSVFMAILSPESHVKNRLPFGARSYDDVAGHAGITFVERAALLRQMPKAEQVIESEEIPWV